MGQWQPFTFAPVEDANPGFDGRAFVIGWGRFVGSAHRHYETRELYLCHVSTCPHPADRDRLLEELRADPRNVGSILAAIDERDRRNNQAVMLPARRLA